MDKNKFVEWLKETKGIVFKNISDSGLDVEVSRNETAQAYLKGATTVMDEIAELVQSGKFDKKDEVVFTEEELKFINAMIEDNLFSYNIKRTRIEDYQKVKEFDEIMKPRMDFMQILLDKIGKELVKE